MSFHHARLTLAAVGTLALLATSAVGQRIGGMAACRTDAATFCQGIEAGGGKRVRCLMEHRKDVSAECGAAIDTRLAQAQQKGSPTPPASSGASSTTTPSPTAPTAATAAAPRPLAACREDAATLCPGVVAGKGARLACLKTHQDKLSPACTAAIAAIQQSRQAGRAACRTDAKRLCGDAKGPMQRQCLQQKRAEVSPECAATLRPRAAAKQ